MSVERTPRPRPSWTRAFATVAAILMLVIGATLSTASAAQLTVEAGVAASAATRSACASTIAGGQAVVQTAVGDDRWLGQSSRIRVSAVPASCAGLLLEVFVHNAAGGIVAQGSATASSAVTVPVNAPYTVAAVAAVVVRIDGWIFATRWADPGPGPVILCQAIDPGGQVSAARSCNATAGGPQSYWAGGELVSYTVTWVGAQPPAGWRWRVTLDLSQAPFNRPNTSRVGTAWGSPTIALSQGYSCGQLPLFSFTGTSQAAHSGQLRLQPGWLSVGQSLCN